MIQALITGKVYGQFQSKTSGAGKQYVTGKVRVPTEGEQAVFCNVVAFADTVKAQLLTINPETAVSLAGTMKVGLWQPESGEPCVNISMVADQCLTVHHIERQRKAIAQAKSGPSDKAPTPDQMTAYKAAHAPLPASNLEDMSNDIPF